MKTARLALICFLWTCATVAPAAAWTVGAGWTRSDVGLHEDGDGFWAGVGRRTPLTGVLDLAWSLDYVQKRGAQPMIFSSVDDPVTRQDAEVTLHYLQPAVFLGASLHELPLRPRLYAGGSFGMKIEESWNDFPGTPSTALAYKDSDFVGQVGLGLAIGPVELDVRYMKGFGGSLILDQTARGGAKAETDLPGVNPPRIGAKLETLALGVNYRF